MTAGRFERARQESPSHTCSSSFPSLIDPAKNFSILGQRFMRERKKVGSPLPGNPKLLENCSATLRVNRIKLKTASLCILNFLSLLNQRTPNQLRNLIQDVQVQIMFSTTLTYTCIYTQNSFRFEVAYVFITISTSKPVLLNHLFAFHACFKKPYILGVSDEISQHLLSL